MTIRGRQFAQLQEFLQSVDNVVIDIGASNVEKLLKLMRRYRDSQRLVHPLDHLAQCHDHHRLHPVVKTERQVTSAGFLRQNRELLSGRDFPGWHDPHLRRADAAGIADVAQGLDRSWR